MEVLRQTDVGSNTTEIDRKQTKKQKYINENTFNFT
jgi:hypothetical protein